MAKEASGAQDGRVRIGSGWQAQSRRACGDRGQVAAVRVRGERRQWQRSCSARADDGTSAALYQMKQESPLMADVASYALDGFRVRR